ncbi:hypothetical protein EXU48_01920 [Occultella glacieicola]|uniref:Uncharacterized protein n=1 Tax=Occultella glacieicola TaxID=2518684 RepID=A0ABY2E8Y4_9MICO|nr:hypothetical protein [Occultella glacieicola]TDE98969.1 hypothetical protein EXU48_01920 [Occultella glacieicola]
MRSLLGLLRVIAILVAACGAVTVLAGPLLLVIGSHDFRQGTTTVEGDAGSLVTLLTDDYLGGGRCTFEGGLTQVETLSSGSYEINGVAFFAQATLEVTASGGGSITCEPGLLYYLSPMPSWLAAPVQAMSGQGLTGPVVAIGLGIAVAFVTGLVRSMLAEPERRRPGGRPGSPTGGDSDRSARPDLPEPPGLRPGEYRAR